MAGKVGVDCYDYLINSGFLVGFQDELQLTSNGQEFFQSLGIDISKEKKTRILLNHVWIGQNAVFTYLVDWEGCFWTNV